MFFFLSERELKNVLRDMLTRAGMDSYRHRPWGGKKEEFRDWTSYAQEQLLSGSVNK